MGLLRWLFKEPDLLVLPPERQEPEGTVVHLRSREVPAAHWEASVLYDAWGAPYVEWVRGNPGVGSNELFADGTCAYTFLYGTEWRHKSGPPVAFGKAPADLFGQPVERNETAEGDQSASISNQKDQTL